MESVCFIMKVTVLFLTSYCPHVCLCASVLCYHEAAVYGAAGRVLLAPSRRASERDMLAAVMADLEMISPALGSSADSTRSSTSGTSADGSGPTRTSPVAVRSFQKKNA